MTTNLLSTDTGRQTLARIACYLGRARMSKHFNRSFYRAFDAWRTAEQLIPGSGYFNMETLLNDLNGVTQDEIAYLNALLAELGCLEGQMLSDMTIYVDPINGSDISGDGSSSNPYQSLEFLKAGTFPNYINHALRILLLGDYETDTLSFDQTIGPLGSLSIIGVGEPSVITTSAGAGPFALTGATSYGTAHHAHELTFSETFGVDELYGKWIRFKTGSLAGECLPIHENTAHTIWTRAGWSVVPSLGDTFEVVEPARTLQAQTWNLALKGPKNVHDANGEASRFNLMNLKVDIRGAYNEENQFVLKNEVLTQISFVTLIYDNTDFSWLKIESDLNQNRSWDMGIAALTDSDLLNIDMGLEGDATCCGLLVYRTTAPTLGYNEVQIDGPAREVAAIDGRGRCYVTGHMGLLTRSGFGKIRGDAGAVCSVALALITGDVSGGALDLQICGSWSFDVSHVRGGQDIFNLYMGKLKVVVGNITKGTFTGHGFRFAAGNAQVVVGADPAALTGTTGDIHFPGAVGTTAFPAADAAATDSLGNVFARIETA